MRPGATVQAKEGRREITGLAGRLRGMLSWCRITGLHLRGVILRMADVEEIVGLLGQCGSLAHLDLGGHGIGDEEVGRLAGVLGECRSLAHLNLSVNSIGAEGAGRLRASGTDVDIISDSIEEGEEDEEEDDEEQEEEQEEEEGEEEEGLA